ncbi:hypothetical protein [Mesorhizobium sp. Pch-S]|uniref:hypothetical protein n=1 Tax=Mesorhizobium sp. Pch-S TaxID=2082387 RepID=UPI0010132C2A|nr:hypothetical protein [Mesorhizobium sp. Pch-S]QAZ45919.1 hypothetical protein C1M53_26400 [Mesorhizobium sp. Pch-S]
MTAEIAILNKSAVALATDSKVTLTQSGRQKTYDTVDKLFSLSKTEPVGAMIYGNAEFIGFPWETIVKEYRRKTPNVSFPTVFDWADNFTKFLKEFFPFGQSDEDAVAVAIAQSSLINVSQEAFQGTRNQEEFAKQFEQFALAYIAELEAAPEFLTEAEWGPISARISGTLDSACSNGMMRHALGHQALARKLCETSIRRMLASPAATGLVIAGFGERDLLPSLISFDVDGILGGRLKIAETHKHDMTRRDSGVILPFAQTDMVERFMQGIDPAYSMLIHESVGELILNSVVNAAKLLGHSDEDLAKVAPAIENATQAAVHAFWEGHERHRREYFASPIIEMAMSLPKDELANLAESLVSLTSLQRRVSRELETVGGAIDVAVISKGDGFVWIKRKHYFNPDRNLRFVNGYFYEHSRKANPGGPDVNNA